MSDATDMAERHGRILAEISELGLGLARELQQRALAAEAPEAAADLANAFHRISRSVRQTLALEARLERERRRRAQEDVRSCAAFMDPRDKPGDDGRERIEITPLPLRRPRLYIRRSSMTIDKDARLKKLRFRAWRRGFREADLILGPFADQHVQDFDAAELDWFERLLEVPDQDLYAWIIGREEPPAEFQGPIMDRIRAFRFEVHETVQGLRGDDHGG